MDLEQALSVLAEPESHARARWHEAADALNDGLEREAAELAALEERAKRDVLDLLSRRAVDDAQRLGDDVAAKRMRVAQLVQAAKEARRRMQRTLDQAKEESDREHWARAEEVAAKRVEQVRKLVDLGQQLGECYKQISVLGDQLWATLPVKPISDPALAEFYAADAIEYGVGRWLYYASGGLLGETWPGVAGGILGVPDLVSACQAGHGHMMSKRPRAGLSATLVVDAAEFGRRRKAAGGA
jgi:hypothetical protein